MSANLRGTEQRLTTSAGKDAAVGRRSDGRAYAALGGVLFEGAALEVFAGIVADLARSADSTQPLLSSTS